MKIPLTGSRSTMVVILEQLWHQFRLEGCHPLKTNLSQSLSRVTEVVDRFILPLSGRAKREEKNGPGEKPGSSIFGIPILTTH